MHNQTPCCIQKPIFFKFDQKLKCPLLTSVRKTTITERDTSILRNANSIFACVAPAPIWIWHETNAVALASLAYLQKSSHWIEFLAYNSNLPWIRLIYTCCLFLMLSWVSVFIRHIIMRIIMLQLFIENRIFT